MIGTSEVALRTPSLSSAIWYISVVLGWGLCGIAVFEVVTAPITTSGAPLAMIAVLLVALELLPLVHGRGHDPPGVVISTAFVCAMLFLWGPWPAILMIAIAAGAAQFRAHHGWSKLFNAGQYSASVAAGYLVMVIAGVTPSLAEPLGRFHLLDMMWVVGVWVVYFSSNLTLIVGLPSRQKPFRDVLLDEFGHYTATTFAVLALSPLVVVIVQTTWVLLPLLLVPLVLVHHTARMSKAREHDAAHDALTGLPNRASLRAALDGALTRHQRDGRPFGLLLIDMDDFKRVNDTLGHQVGDDMLMHLARRLRDSTRPGDQVARLGGDEFAVIVQGADALDARVVAERIRDALTSPIELHGVALETELSIGIVICPDHGVDGDALLRRADVAMYVAKDARAGIETYASERDRNTADRLSLLGELRQALDDDSLELHYQPKVSTHDLAPIGVEALVRWRHPQRGFVPPDEFIPLAERSGIMPLLTERVVSLALGQISTWRDQRMEVPVAVNISPTDLVGGHLVDLVTEGLRRHALPPGTLQLEITERVVAQQTEETSAVLDRLREMGVTVSLDDFGTGYSSLLRLQSFPVDEIKIDRAFVSRLSQSYEARGIVRAVIDLAHALGLPAIAEGVETQEEWQTLRELGCDGVQGWHIAMPMAEAQASEWLRARTAVGRLPAPRRRPPAHNPIATSNTG